MNIPPSVHIRSDVYNIDLLHCRRNQILPDTRPCFRSPISSSLISAHLTVLAGIKLLGFKDASELAIEDNIKHSTFIYPDEQVQPVLLTIEILECSSTMQAYSGSKRTFNALLKTLIKKNKIGLVRVLLRSNASPLICALVPQVYCMPRTSLYNL